MLKCFWERNLKAYSVLPPQDPQVSGTIGTKTTLTSNSRGGHNCLVHGIREGHNFLCRCEGRVIIFQSYNISEFATLPPDNFWPLPKKKILATQVRTFLP